MLEIAGIMPLTQLVLGLTKHRVNDLPALNGGSSFDLLRPTHDVFALDGVFDFHRRVVVEVAEAATLTPLSAAREGQGLVSSNVKGQYRKLSRWKCASAVVNLRFSPS